MASDWKTGYEARTVCARKALEAIHSGSRVFMAAGCGRPQLLIDELVNLGSKIADIELIHLMTFGLAPYTSAEYHERFRHNALFIGEDVVSAVTEGRADFTPTNKLQIARLFRDRRLPIDVCLIQVSPPDDRGFVSTGITVGISKTAAEAARYMIAEVNPRMPRTCGDSLIHVDQIHAFVQSDHPLLEAPARKADAVAHEIARHCSRLIDDGATIHIGYTPEGYALPKYLADRKDLGIHTDVLTPPHVELMQRGIVTNARKSINTGKTITSLCYGTASIYAYLGDNPQIEFHPALYVNDPFVISQHDEMVSITEARKVDLTGLVSSRFVGPRFGSGFMVGASHARRGRAIVTLASTRDDGNESNIVMDLDPGRGIALTTNRDDVHYVITEYGIAELLGRSIRERALALIHIAHPKFRYELMEAAKERHYVYADQMPQLHKCYPDRFESSLTLEDGTGVLLRPALPTDERKVQTFLYGMDEASIRYRFHGKLERLHHDRVQCFVNVDYQGTVTILALRLSADGEEREVVGIGQYLNYPDLNQAEAAFVTGLSYRNRGIATALLKTLISMARDRGIPRMFAQVLRENMPMVKVFKKSGVPTELAFEDGFHHIELEIMPVAPPGPQSPEPQSPVPRPPEPAP